MTRRGKRDAFKSRGYREYAEHFWNDVAPKIRDSGYMITVTPPKGSEDVKIATELGYSILLDKPLIVFVPAGRREHMAEKLLRIADHIIEGDMDSDAGRAEMQRKLAAILNQ